MADIKRKKMHARKTLIRISFAFKKMIAHKKKKIKQ